MDLDQLLDRFESHSMTEDKQYKVILLRRNFQDIARLLYRELPEGRDKSLAFTKLEEASMHANAAIARS